MISDIVDIDNLNQEDYPELFKRLLVHSSLRIEPMRMALMTIKEMHPIKKSYMNLKADELLNMLDKFQCEYLQLLVSHTAKYER